MSAWLRARVHLGVVLPLLEVVAHERRDVASRLRSLSGRVAIRGPGEDLGATIAVERGKVTVERAAEGDVTCSFRDVAALDAFFSGRAALPSISPLGALRHPVLLAKTAWLVSTLRVLQPRSPRELAAETPADRALRVRLVLYLVTAAMSRLAKDGFGPARALAEASPDRVYQWTVGGSDVGAWLRVNDGRIRAGRGVYPHRRPFVAFAFRDMEAAHRVITAQASQMESYTEGLVATAGSPEYVRKVTLVMQKVDALMLDTREA